MSIIKRSTLAAYWRKYPDARSSLKQWLEVTQAADWHSIQHVRATFPHADAATVASGNTVTVFNVGGNVFRLIVSIKYRWGVVYIRDFMTHAEYTKEAWKKRH